MPQVANARAPKSTAFSFDGSKMVKIIVGRDEGKTFVAHEGILTSKSEFFKRAMSANWEESKTRTVRLSNDDPENFGNWLHLAYTNQIPIAGDTELSSLTSEAYRVALTEEYKKLACLYVLSEKLQDTRAKNACLLAILAVCQTRNLRSEFLFPSAASVKIIYNGTTEGDAARRLVVDLWVHTKTETISEALDILPKEFYRDLVAKLMTRMDATNGRRNDTLAWTGLFYLNKVT